MSDSAKVSSIDAIKGFRLSVAKFVQEVTNAIAEIDADIHRVAGELRYERLPYWNKQVIARQEAVIAARTERSRKELMSMSDMPSLVEERRNLDKAKRAVEEAQQKIEAVKKWARLVDRESMLFKGQLQSLSDAVCRDLPEGIVRLGKMIAALEAYAAMAPVSTEQVGESSGSGFVARVGAALRGESVTSAALGPGSITAALRRRTPGRTVLDAVEMASPGFLAGTGPMLPDDGLLTKLGLAGEKVDGSGRVVLAIGGLGGSDYYVERMVDDGSWYVGPTSPSAATAHFEAVTAGELLALRPALREVLELPRGYLAAVVAGSVQSVITPSPGDQEVLAI